ncbi:cytochrome c [Dyella sp. A6]|uniref:c-type cytochrome n=1 Tax=Dyella aluminiiresistens TaxID=3069105 RepID=UPI002E774143|nr:cytochrome c [Dyella sp. A6]
MTFFKTVLAVVLVALLGIAGFVYSGWYDIGADSPHWASTFAVLNTLRQRSIAHHAEGVTVPGDLDDPKVILKGAGQYAAMCTGCHLAPGMAGSEIRPGLYPRPPVLWHMQIDPREAFWVIKHGIKMSAMPAWGTSHDDATIWSMVAFLRKLPTLSPAEYLAIVAKAPPDDDMDPAHKATGKSASSPAPATSAPASAATAM